MTIGLPSLKWKVDVTWLANCLRCSSAAIHDEDEHLQVPENDEDAHLQVLGQDEDEHPQEPVLDEDEHWQVPGKLKVLQSMT